MHVDAQMHKWTCEAVYVKQVDTSCISMRRYAYYKIKRIHTYPKLLASLLSPFLGLQSTNEIDHYCAQYDRVLWQHLKYLCHTTPPAMHNFSTTQNKSTHRGASFRGTSRRFQYRCPMVSLCFLPQIDLFSSPWSPWPQIILFIGIIRHLCIRRVHRCPVIQSHDDPFKETCPCQKHHVEIDDEEKHGQFAYHANSSLQL